MTTPEAIDPARPIAGRKSARANRGDICVAFDRWGTGAYFVGEVCKHDEAGGTIEILVGRDTVRVVGMGRMIEPRGNFIDSVTRAFSRYRDFDSAVAALWEHIHPKAKWSQS